MAEPTQTACELGYHMPAEFESTDAVWFTRPHNKSTWPGCLDDAQRQFDHLIHQVERFTRAQVIGRDHDWLTNDSWIRDYGPIFVRAARGLARSQGGLALHDFTFNCWGNKYDDFEHDDVIPQHVARHLDVPIWQHDFVLEGGAIDVNGQGTVMTTEQCLLNPNRNPHLSREQIEQQLHDALGTRHVVWLPGGIAGDDTDGHIDDVARFVSPSQVVAIRAAASHPDHELLERNWVALQRATEQDGQPLDVTALPVPAPIYYDYPADEYGPGGRRQLPASYANFLIANGGVLVPTFGQPADEVALQTLRDLLPGREVVGVPCDKLVVGLGAIHCMSMQQPSV